MNCGCCGAGGGDSVQILTDSSAILYDAQPRSEPDAAGVDCDGNVFTATLSRGSEGLLGFKVDVCDQYRIHICRMLPDAETAIAVYNASAPQEKQINIGDYILAVNTVSNKTVQAPMSVAAAMREELLNGEKAVSLVVSRPYIFKCKVERQNKPMGVELTYCDDAISLVVARVNAGAVQTTAPEIRPGDRILSVDGCQGSSEELVRVFRAAGESMLLQMSRPCASEADPFFFASGRAEAA